MTVKYYIMTEFKVAESTVNSCWKDEPIKVIAWLSSFLENSIYLGFSAVVGNQVPKFIWPPKTSCKPCAPCTPCAPRTPCAPCAPCTPCTPCAPCTPCTSAAIDFSCAKDDHFTVTADDCKLTIKSSSTQSDANQISQAQSTNSEAATQLKRQDM